VRLPGFTAECSITRRGFPAHAKRLPSGGDGLELSFNRDGSTPIYFPPDFCQPGYSPTLVKTGGETVCLRWVAGQCIFKGTPFEKCWPDRCINYQTTNVEYHWECQPRLFTIGE